MYELPNAELFFLDSKNNLGKKTIHDELKGKTVVLFGIPGAFTPTCSNSQVPDFESSYDEILSLGVDDVYCISVNDPFVMKAWWKQLKVKKVKYLSDGNAAFTARLDNKAGHGDHQTFYVKKYNKGLGVRSWRYAMIISDNIVIKVLDEQLDGSTSRDNCEADPYVRSTPESVIEYLKSRTVTNLKTSAGEDLSAPQ